MSFVCHAPPGTAVYYERFKGWTVNDHLTVDMLEVLDMLLWVKSRDAQKNRNRPKRRPRPGAENVKGQKQQKQQVDENAPMTVAEYVKRTGMKIELEGR